MTDERHSIDKLFHESLDGHRIEPSAGLWASLEKDIPAGNTMGLIRYLVSAVAIGIISIGLSTLIITTPEISEQRFTGKEKQVLQSDNALQEQNESATVPEEESMAPVEATAQARAEEPAMTKALPATNVPGVQRQTKDNKASSHEDVTTERLSYPLLDQHETVIASVESPGMKSRTESDIPAPVYGISLKNDYVQKADLLFGAGFSPAVNIFPDGQNRNDFSFEMIAAYEKSRFILEGGIGANYTSEGAKYGIKYSSYDSVGYFINVNAFGVDPSKPDSVWFETSMKGIYDSIDHYRIEEKTNKYAYLQVPVRLGYRVLQTDRFSIDLKIGLIFSLQVYKNVPDIPYEGNDVERIDVIRHYPDRLATHWQYTASAGINYHFNEHMRLSLSPFYRQYIKSVYTSGSDFSARSPHAFGIRGALYFHF
ncbi:MAG TPA: outer membrane beta-barrel protein [Bacteroidales bacterium]|nr:outer membrane beta-barrel protein [Bacteroidales bacterium]